MGCFNMGILSLLEMEEGYRQTPYYCSEGFPTVGIGKRIGPKNADLNLYQFAVDERTSRAWLESDVNILTGKLIKLDWFNQLSTSKQAVITSMAYQLGYNGLLKFKRMIAALKRKDYAQAADEALDSKWSEQTPNRAARHAKVLSGYSLSRIYNL